jgi:hypothetical protein
MTEQAKVPFEFVAASYLVRILPERAWTLGELAKFLRTVPDASIFYHTFQSLETHHYAAFSSDFAQWVMAACNEAALAEQLAAVDLRESVSIEELRKELSRIVEGYLQRNPQSVDRPAFEPFYFCEAREVTVPVGMQANTLEELVAGIRELSVQTVAHHFINSRLRLHLETNDFSHWIKDSLQMPRLAARLNYIDFYTNDLQNLRKEIVQTIESGVRQ